VDLERGRLVLRDELERVIGGLEEVWALEELRASLVPGLEDHLEEFVHRLLGGDRPDDRLQLGFVLRRQLDAVLFGERLRQLRAGEETAGHEDLAEAAPVVALRGERTFELGLRQELQVDEQFAEWAPRPLRLGRDRSRRRRCPLLGRELDAVLLGKNARERERGEVAVGDEYLAQEAAARRLLRERLLELVLGQQLFGDQELAELTPGKLKR